MNCLGSIRYEMHSISTGCLQSLKRCLTMFKICVHFLKIEHSPDYCNADRRPKEFHFSIIFKTIYTKITICNFGFN